MLVEFDTARRSVRRTLYGLGAALFFLLSPHSLAQQQTAPSVLGGAASPSKASPGRPIGGLDAPKSKPVAQPAEGQPGTAQRTEAIRSTEAPAILSSGQNGNAGRPYLLGSGDAVRITVFQQPDMTTETRVSEVGTLTFPLLGPVEAAGLSSKQVEVKIGNLLKSRGFVRDPQVNVNVL